MGNGASNPIGQAVAKQQMNSAFGDAKQGAQSSKETEEQKQRRLANEARAKARVSEYEEKKKASAQRKSKLKEQWVKNKKANS